VSSLRDHIPFALLADFSEGRQVPDDQARDHLAACARCAGELASLQRLIGVMRTDRSADAPADLIARVKGLFRAPAAAPGPSLRRRLVAALSFDSARAPLAFGVRAGEISPRERAAAQRQMLFNAGALDIDLRLTPVGGTPADERALWVVTGQVLGSEGGRRVELRGPGGAPAAAINDQGEFALPPIPAGHYALTLQLADLDIDIPDLAIGAA
jgi:hypothetical protein